MRLTSGLNLSLCLATALIATAGHAATVTVFAAASLTDCLRQIASEHERRTGDKITLNFAGSSLLARQIEEGAPADIFFSADESWMDELEKKGLLLKGTRRSRLSNSLVIIVARDSPLALVSPRDLAKPSVARIALADPQAVPAGKYARQFLEKENLWATLQAKVVPTGNVRGALAAVESGDVEAAIVYKTDAAISKRVKVAYEVPSSGGPTISYPMAVLSGTREPAAAKRFLEYLNSPSAGRVFAQFGFIVRGEER
ncbi:MAG: molybdate ABC transporter substrate-binding protein [Verrucomicrobiota bacterium]|jgi:molybdate transport system substrate-binding protein